jgi:hypothetical protein
MQTVLTALLFLVLIGGTAYVLAAYFRGVPAHELRFRLRYAALPLLTLAVSLIVTVWLGPKLTADAAFNFGGGVTPAGYFSRGAVLGITLGLQVAIALPVIAVSWITLRLRGSDLNQTEGGGEDAAKLDRVLLLVTNLVALPQMLLLFALAEILSYNIYGAHLIPGWAFGAAILVTGAVFLALLFRLLPERRRKQKTKEPLP